LLIAFYAFPFYKIVTGGGLHKNGLYVLLIMWAPAVSALLTRLILGKFTFGFRPGHIKYLALAFILPVVGALLVYSIAWLTGIGEFDRELFQRMSPWYYIGLVGVPSSALSAAGEEIGWRGFLVPELAKKYAYTKTSLITAAIWSLYHYPLLLFSDYNNGISIVSSLIFFTISVTGVCFITSWLRLKSGSLWGAVLLHSAHNFYIQGVFDKLTISKAFTQIFTTEFGIGLAVFYVIAALFFWRRRRALDTPLPQSAESPAV
jgi:membrane protease YdiL (CAAX protease family)